MSFGLGIGFGRLVKEIGFPDFQIIWDKNHDYFNVIYKDGRQSNECDDGEYIFGKDDSGYYMLNKKCLVSGRRSFSC
jgi:hypothetical protein